MLHECKPFSQMIHTSKIFVTFLKEGWVMDGPPDVVDYTSHHSPLVVLPRADGNCTPTALKGPSILHPWCTSMFVKGDAEGFQA